MGERQPKPFSKGYCKVLKYMYMLYHTRIDAPSLQARDHSGETLRMSLPKRKWYTFKGDNTVIKIFTYNLKEASQEYDPRGSKFFSFRITQIIKGLILGDYTGNETYTRQLPDASSELFQGSIKSEALTTCGEQ